LLTESVTESTREANAMQATPSTSPEMSPAVGQLIRIVGHDLKNKLGVVTNSIYYLNMKLGHSDAKVQKHLRIMGREVANANRMIANLMDFALLKAPALRQSDIKTIIAEALSQASLPDYWETTIHLDDGLPSLMADGFQLQRALTNIILRIVEGVPGGGNLQISARVQDGFMELGFEAAGLIIPEENLPGAAAPLASAGGTSLGMAVSKMLVEGHEGTIQAKRLARNETVFVVKLPL
jgi:K+-sensing histidine kinase KdpD